MHLIHVNSLQALIYFYPLLINALNNNIHLSCLARQGLCLMKVAKKGG